MPATFASLGLKFLYPDNWVIAGRAADEGDSGVTFELPTGGFFSIEVVAADQSDRELIEAAAESIAQEYGEVERDDTSWNDGNRTVDFQFYYLDLLVVSRVQLIAGGGRRYFLQMQAESRDFAENERVFEAILQQIAPSR